MVERHARHSQPARGGTATRPHPGDNWDGQHLAGEPYPAIPVSPAPAGPAFAVEPDDLAERPTRSHRAAQREIPKPPRWMGAGRPALHKLTRNRRQALIALGGGAVTLAGLSAGMAVGLRGGDERAGHASPTGANQTPREAGSFSNRDASYTEGVGDSNDLEAGGLADTPSAAAQAAMVATPRFTTPLTRDPVAHLLRRTTFGPTPQDVAEVKQLGIDAWLDRQLAPESIPDPAGDGINAMYPLLALDIPALRGAVADDKRGDPSRQLGRFTIGRQVWTSRQLFEVMVDFWNNHLNIQNPFDGGEDNRTDWDRSIIRKYAFGKYSDMLLASARHPAMLRYLNNADSDKRAVNENYGRELLELHTVGIDGGYGETDVRQCAYVLTGRTVSRNGTFVYEPRRHYTGAVKVMGWSHPNKNASEGLAVGDTLVRYLAMHPSTAKYIARKLAVRFVCDSPPAALVDRLAKAYLENGSATLPVLKVLFRSIEFWIATGLKTRRPLENIVATARVLGVQPGTATDKALDDLFKTAENLGHAPLAWGPPDGYPDVAGAWQSAHGMLGVWNNHRAMIQGNVKGIKYTSVESFVGANRSGTAGGYLDALAQRLVFQPLSAPQRDALLRFAGLPADARVTDPKLGGRLEHLAPLFLDSVYHGLR